MYDRIIQFPHDQSFFLFGPRGTGKTTWLKTKFPKAIYLDLLDSELYTTLLSHPAYLERYIPADTTTWVILDEVQRVPQLLHEVHRLIESRQIKFILTGSSARKLKQKDTNLLAGRAWTYFMHPLTNLELGENFNFQQALRWGQLPAAVQQKNPQRYLQSYVATYLREEVQQEGLTRNIASFSRFLEAASFSQAQVLNISAIARDCQVHRKVVEDYFTILEDLLIAERVPAFTKHAKRKLVMHPKFFFFDVGVFRAIRPAGPLDSPMEIDGPALETLVYQELKALNNYLQFGYTIYYWRTTQQQEVDFVLYGERGLIALEIKRSPRVDSRDLRGLQIFCKEYPIAKPYLLYTGNRAMEIKGVTILPIIDFLRDFSTKHAK